MILHGMNGLGCLGFSILPFAVLGVVGLRNSLRERKGQDPRPPLPRYGRRWRVARVSHGAQGAPKASEMSVDA